MPGRQRTRRTGRDTLLAQKKFLDGVADIGLRTAELGAAGGRLIARETLLQRRFGLTLQRRVDGRAHNVGLGGQADDAVRFRFAAEKIDKVQTAVAPLLLEGDELRRRRHCVVLVLGRNDAVVLHAAKHVGEAFLGAFGMAVGIEKARTFEQAGEHGAFGQREVLRRFAEIAARRHLHAPGAAAEISGIEIEFEDFRLAERALDAGGHDHLADLALVGHVVADQEVLHHLLGDGRAALRTARVGEITNEGADDAALVDAVMIEEAPVFGRDERLLHQIGNGGERDPDPAVARFEHVGEIAALAVEDHAHARQLGPLSRVWSGMSAAALLKNSITWPRSTTGLATLSFLQN